MGGFAGGQAMNGDADRPTLPALAGGEAEFLEGTAAAKRAAARACGNTLMAAQLRAEADGLEALALAARDLAAGHRPPLYAGLGSEVMPREDPDATWKVREAQRLVNGPSAVLAADASQDRLTLAHEAGVLNLAVETATDAGAATAVEKMLAHQLAAVHQLAMRLFGAADGDLTRHVKGRAMKLNPTAQVEAARGAAAAARLLDAFARGAVALDRLRNGARQTVIVHRMEVKDGGQAVVAGSVETKRTGDAG